LLKTIFAGSKRLDSVHVIPGDAKNKLVEEIVDSKVLTYGVVEIYDAEPSMRKRCMELNIPFASLGFKEKKLLLQFFSLYRYVLINKPKTLFLHSFYPSVFGVGLVFLCPFTKIISVRHHNRVHLLSHNRKGALLDKIVARFCYKTIAVSNTVKETLVSQGCKQEKVVVIYNGLNSLKQSNERVTRKENSPSLRLLAAGRLDWQKNYETMLLVAAELKKRDIDFSLSILGSGGDIYTSKLFEMTRALNLEDRVKWLGWQKSVENWFSQSDIFLHTALDEACPLVLIEALLYGIPIVTSEAGGSGEVIRGFYAGCPGADVSAFTEEIISTWSNIRESTSKALSLVPIAEKKFGAETMRKEYELVTLSFLD
jgi:glycosyltransferase involved in cell wall biosynthesis